MRLFRLVQWLCLPVIGSCATAQEGFSFSDESKSIPLSADESTEDTATVEQIDAALTTDTGAETTDSGTDDSGERPDRPPRRNCPPKRDSGYPPPPERDSGGPPPPPPERDSGFPTSPTFPDTGCPDDTGFPADTGSPDDTDTGDVIDTGEPDDSGTPSDTDDSAASETGEPNGDTSPDDTDTDDTEDSGLPAEDSAPTDPIEDTAAYDTGTPGSDEDSAEPDSADTASVGPMGEQCDGLDNDLDGFIDEDAFDAIAWYTDSDGDGIGGDLSGIACEPPNPGDMSESGDCDDADPSAHPGALEVCDGADNNCDYGVDNDAIDASTWYADNDGDGYGDSANALTDCLAPDGYTDVALDCDDSSAEVSPDAVETCNSVDDDCSGTTDDNGGDCTVIDEEPGEEDTGAPADTGVGDTGLDTGDWNPEDSGDGDGDSGIDTGDTGEAIDEDCSGAWYEDVDGDGYGDPNTSAVGCTPGPDWLRNDDDCDDTTWAVSPVAAELCDGIDNDCDGEIDESDAIDAPPRYLDADADGYGVGDTVVRLCSVPAGYAAFAGDCDDTDAAISPAAAEYCDGIDNDCGEGIDEVSAVDAPTWFMDVDSDGFAGTLTRTACIQPDDTYTVSDDCNDSDPMVSPAGYELCNDIDDDCNNVIDDATVTGAGWWYLDADEDDYGDIATALWSCSSIEGYVENGDDCDDANSGAAPKHREICDEIDNNCDGAIDELGASGERDWYADADADGYGDQAVTTEACAAPAGFVGDWKDCDDTATSTNPGALEVCGDTVDNDCDGVSEACGPWGERAVAVADASFAGEKSTDDAGRSAAFVPDTDGDGLDDIVIGAGRADPGTTDGGATYILRGNYAGAMALGEAAARIIGESGADQSGFAVAGLADVDGDGLGDVVIGAYKDGLGGIEAGAVFISSGSVQGEVALDDARLILTGEVSGDWAGYSVATLDDATGDGRQDLLIGSPYEDSGGSKAGAAYIVSTTHTGTRSLALAEASFYGEVSLDRAGTAVGDPGDIDGDGVGDILVGAWGDSVMGSRAGAAYIVYGPVNGEQSLADADAKRTGETAGHRAGWAVGGGGDVDGDGLDDALIGAPYASKTYALGGAQSGSASLSTAAVVFVGSETSFRAGSSVATGGDFDADGSVDVLIGAPGEDSGGTEAGAVFVVAGPVSGMVDLDGADGILIGANSRDVVGTGVAGDADVDGDGFSDVIVGAPGSDLGGSETGGAYLFFGADRE